jgi:hypothetical protein
MHGKPFAFDRVRWSDENVEVSLSIMYLGYDSFLLSFLILTESTKYILR